MTHILIQHPEPAEATPYVRYSVECPGVSDSCRMWLECGENGCPPFAPGSDAEDDAKSDGEYVAHSQGHRLLDGLDWCTPEDRCFIADNPDLYDAGDELDLPGPGRYQVELWRDRYDDSTTLRLRLVEPVVVAG